MKGKGTGTTQRRGRVRIRSHAADRVLGIGGELPRKMPSQKRESRLIIVRKTDKIKFAKKDD